MIIIITIIITIIIIIIVIIIEAHTRLIEIRTGGWVSGYDCYKAGLVSRY